MIVKKFISFSLQLISVCCTLQTITFTKSENKNDLVCCDFREKLKGVPQAVKKLNTKAVTIEAKFQTTMSEAGICKNCFDLISNYNDTGCCYKEKTSVKFYSQRLGLISIPLYIDHYQTVQFKFLEIDIELNEMNKDTNNDYLIAYKDNQCIFMMYEMRENGIVSIFTADTKKLEDFKIENSFIGFKETFFTLIRCDKNSEIFIDHCFKEEF